MHRDKYKKGIAIADSYDPDTNDEGVEVGIAEWTWNNKPMSCPWVKVMEDNNDFDITKADKIFDLLLEKGQLQLSPNHTLPSTEELKKKYCKFHNSVSHNTDASTCSKGNPTRENQV